MSEMPAALLKDHKIPTIVVVMSTYNGEEFVFDQIQSILRQIGVTVTLFVRDDCSQDNTLSIIKNIKDSRVHLVEDNYGNLGPGMSFLRALGAAPRADYYAFSDQDDIWLDDKLIKAINELRQTGGPGVYCSTATVVDSKLNVIDSSFGLTHPYSLRESLVYRAPMGCTMVFNSKMKDIIVDHIPSSIRMHDHWVILSAEVLGANIFIDASPHMLYRQHGNNAVGSNQSLSSRLHRLINSNANKPNERLRQAISLLQEYEERVDMETEETLLQFISYNSSVKDKFLLIKDTLPFLPFFYIKILFILSVLLGLF